MSTALIHPSAVISTSAHIGNNVRIGPGAVIEANCIIGDDCEIRAHAILTGATLLGKNNQIGYGAVVGAEPQDLNYNGAPTRVVIGDNNILREMVTVHRGTKEGTETVIGNNNFLMAGAHIAHNCRIANHVIIVNNVLLAGHVEIHDRAFLGGGCVAHQFTRVGELAMMRGLTRISKDVPPYFMAVATNRVSSVNRVGLKRAGFSPQARRSIVEAFKLLHRSSLNISQALEKLDQQSPTPEIQKITTFIRQSKRGICTATRHNSQDEE